jgi:hypothetical protein
MPSIPAFFAIFVPLIFYAIGVLVNLLISSSFEEEHFYLGVELTLGSLASSLTYIYGLSNLLGFILFFGYAFLIELK